MLFQGAHDIPGAADTVAAFRRNGRRVFFIVRACHCVSGSRNPLLPSGTVLVDCVARMSRAQTVCM